MTSVLRKDEAGLQELAESVPDLEQEDVSLYTNSLQDNKHGSKHSEQADSLDDSLCEDDGGKEKEYLVPSMEDLTQVTSSKNNADQLISGEKNCNLVDELFDDLPMIPQSTNNSDSIVSENFDKKIAPLFSSAKKKKRFRAPVQSIIDESVCKHPDKGKGMQTCDTKMERTKPVFKSGTKSSTGKKRKLSEVSKDENEKVSEPPMKGLRSDPNEEVTSPDDPVKKVSSMTSKEVSSTVEVKKKKRKKKATEQEDSIKKVKKVKKGADASKKKAAQQQAKIDKSCKNLDREQRKAEKELQKINRDLEKARKQKRNEDKKLVETKQPSTSSSSGQLWVQCDQPDCLKWRRLRDCKNLSEVPEKWFCSMNPDQQFNSCAVPEEDSSDLSDSQEYVYASYAPGTIVWAKVTGYPWWPAMIQYDTNKDTFYEKQPSCHTPIAYHVVFFSKPISRAWVHSLCLQAFLPDKDPNTKVAHKYNKSLTIAVKEADEANQISVEERLVQYSFDKLYTGKSMYVHDEWASDASSKETKKTQHKADN